MRVRATTTRKEEPTVATDISIALEELLDKTGADVDFLREAVRALVQELMEIEVTRQIGAARHERRPNARHTATVIDTGRGTPGWAPSTSTSPSYAGAATSRVGWSLAAVRRRRCLPSFRRPTSAV